MNSKGSEKEESESIEQELQKQLKRGGIVVSYIDRYRSSKCGRGGNMCECVCV